MSVFFSEIISENELQITNWKKIFSSEKCLSINLTKKPNFAAASAGGRIVKFDDENILLSIGDFYADGVNGPMLSQDLNNDYGKILKINIKTKKHEIFSFGHRNPQGLYIDNDGNIFSTEHGPRGGDELNLIKQKIIMDGHTHLLVQIIIHTMHIQLILLMTIIKKKEYGH